MLIKIIDEVGQWTMFDNAERIKFKHEPERIESREDLAYMGNEPNVEVTFILPNSEQSISSSQPLSVGVINFSRLKNAQRVIFRGLAYICNDQGKTVERLEVR